MKTLFLIRGFKMGTSAADPDYAEFRETLAAQGFRVVPSPFRWNNTTMSQYVSKFVEFYNREKGSYNVIVGHSFGAMAALTAASLVTPDLLVLCSLSGYFQEDLPNYEASDWIMKHMGKRRRHDFEQLSGDAVAKAAKFSGVRSVMLYGAKEKKLYPHLYARVQRTAKIIQPIEVIAVPGAEHSIYASPAYLKAVCNATTA